MPNNSKVKKLTRIAKNSLGIMLPASDLKSLGWRERQRVIVKRVARGFMVIDAMTKHKR
jgi:hypothetical protein